MAERGGRGGGAGGGTGRPGGGGGGAAAAGWARKYGQGTAGFWFRKRVELMNKFCRVLGLGIQKKGRLEEENY
jgi:hypothetical protein